jgi:hypothetical protein
VPFVISPGKKNDPVHPICSKLINNIKVAEMFYKNEPSKIVYAKCNEDVRYMYIHTFLVLQYSNVPLMLLLIIRKFFTLDIFITWRKWSWYRIHITDIANLCFKFSFFVGNIN